MASLTTQKIVIADKEIILEHGRFAAQAGGAVIVRLGDTMVLATAVGGKNPSTLSYFPLSVEYQERLYAGGKISTSRFIKREGRPSEQSVLTGRLIDRSIRPLFPHGFKNEVQVIVTTLSVDGDNDPDVLGIIGASAALAISDIPWDGPISGLRVGKTTQGFVSFPTDEQRMASPLDLVVSGSQDAVVMVEAGMHQVDEETVLEAIAFAQEANKAIVAGIRELVVKVGKEKFAYTVPVLSDDLKGTLQAFIEPKISDLVTAIAQKKVNKEDAVGDLKSEAIKHILEIDAEADAAAIAEYVEKSFKKFVREQTLKTHKRVDGRDYTQIRELEMEVGILPRVHGSGMFRRGMTQTLTTVTLGSPALEQIIENAEGEETKRYMHHYNFPPYSVGEVKRMGSPGRREIGHGALAERALLPVVPPKEVFPYAIRVVNEIMSSNGSSSMASVCGSSLALMDAGVPVESAVAGVAMGMMSLDENNYAVLTDIQGVEDALGDMDFKVAGTAKGITALQMDIKLTGLSPEMLRTALLQARDGRMEILKAMQSCIAAPRPELSQYAPKVVMLKIDPTMIGMVIGSGGKTINQIIAACNVTIDIEDDGSVMITANAGGDIDKAKNWVESLVKEVKAGEIYEGKVTRIMNFGAFVEILPGKEGLVHISKLSPNRVNVVEDVVHVGDIVTVRVDEIDNENRINLTMDVAGSWTKSYDEDRSGGYRNGNGHGGRDRDRGGRRR